MSPTRARTGWLVSFCWVTASSSVLVTG
jgi:hypothetical protein